MTAREICEYIAFLDYNEYHAFLNMCYGIYGQTVFKQIYKRPRYIRHKMYVIAFDMIMAGEYYG